MQQIEELIREYLKTNNVIQLATCLDNKPWLCNVHFYADDDLNIYWRSLTTRRHSEEIAQNPNVAAVIKVHENTPEENYIIGMTVEGTAELLAEATDHAIVDAYCQKHGKDAKTADEIKSGNDPNKFYRITPKNFVVFNTRDFEGNPRVEWQPGEAAKRPFLK